MRRQLCPRPFFVFMENRTSNTASSVASGVNSESRNIQKDPASPAENAYKELSKWDAREVSNENDFFTLFEVTPVWSDKAGRCGCASATLP